MLEIIDRCLLWPAPVEFRSSLAERRRITARLVDPSDPDRRLSLRLRPAAVEDSWIGALTPEVDDGSLAIRAASLYPHDSAETLAEEAPAAEVAAEPESLLAALPAVVLQWRRIEDGFDLIDVAGDVETVLGRNASTLKRVPDLLFAGADSVSVAKFRRWHEQPLEQRRSFAMDFPVVDPGAGDRKWLRMEAQLETVDSEERTVALVTDITERKERELDVAESHERLRDVLSGVPGVVVRVRLARDGSEIQSRVAGGNHANLLDIDAAEQTETNDAQLLEHIAWARDLPDVESAFWRALSGNAGVDIEFRVRDSKRRLRWVRLIAEPTAKEKKHVEYTGIITDFSGPKMGMQHLSAVLRSDRDQLRKTAQALKDSERRFRELNDALPVMMHSIDGKGRIVGVNAAWLEALGYSRDEALGDRAEKFMTEAGFVHLAAASAGLSAGGGRRGFACELVAKDGRVIETDAYLRIDEDQDGERRGGDFCFVDVTDRNKAERALAESQERYRAIVDEQTNPVCRIDVDGALLFANRALSAALGAEPDELIGTDWAALHDAEDRERLARALEALGPADPRTELEARLETAAGPAWHRWTIRGFFDAGGRPMQLQATGRDVHAEKTLEAEAHDTSHREQQRIGQALHDGFANELKGMFVELTSLAHSLEHTEPEIYLRMRSVREGVDRCMHAMRALHQGLTAEHLKTDGFVGSLRRLVGNAQALYGVPISFECEPGLDPGSDALSPELYRIAQEALGNAARHGEASCVALRLMRDGDGIVMEIEDDGRGAAGAFAEPDDVGSRLMRYRAAAIGASIDVGESARGGALLRCRVDRGSNGAESRDEGD